MALGKYSQGGMQSLRDGRMALEMAPEPESEGWNSGTGPSSLPVNTTAPFANTAAKASLSTAVCFTSWLFNSPLTFKFTLLVLGYSQPLDKKH